MIWRPLRTPLFPYTTLFRSRKTGGTVSSGSICSRVCQLFGGPDLRDPGTHGPAVAGEHFPNASLDRKSTRLNSSHVAISYAVFCLKKKTTLTGRLRARQLAT